MIWNPCNSDVPAIKVTVLRRFLWWAEVEAVLRYGDRSVRYLRSNAESLYRPCFFLGWFRTWQNYRGDFFLRGMIWSHELREDGWM